MNTQEPRRIKFELTPEQQAILDRDRQLIAEELPELIIRDQLAKDAGEEQTLSGELRRAIHAGDLDLIELSDLIGIPPVMLDEFLTGERTLRSDVLDRLVRALGVTLILKRRAGAEGAKHGATSA